MLLSEELFLAWWISYYTPIFPRRDHSQKPLRSLLQAIKKKDFKRLLALQVQGKHLQWPMSLHK